MQRDRHLASGGLCRESTPLGQGSRASLPSARILSSQLEELLRRLCDGDPI
jgi:hypothetical protein